MSLNIPSENTLAGLAFRVLGMLLALGITVGAFTSVVPYATAGSVVESEKRVVSKIESVARRQAEVEEKVEKNDDKIDDIKDKASETNEKVAGIEAEQKAQGKQLDRIERLLEAVLKKGK